MQTLSYCCGLLDNERWGRRGINRWMDIEFEGGEDGDSDVSGVAIAFLRGHRRSAFFDVGSCFGEKENKGRGKERGFAERSAC